MFFRKEPRLSCTYKTMEELVSTNLIKNKGLGLRLHIRNVYLCFPNQVMYLLVLIHFLVMSYLNTYELLLTLLPCSLRQYRDGIPTYNFEALHLPMNTRVHYSQLLGQLLGQLRGQLSGLLGQLWGWFLDQLWVSPFHRFFDENNFKIITSVPDLQPLKLSGANWLAL
jgi:hypothetical protein